MLVNKSQYTQRTTNLGDMKRHHNSICPNMYLYPVKLINQIIKMLTSQTIRYKSFDLCEAPQGELENLHRQGVKTSQQSNPTPSTKACVIQ